jgi:hypothetical protein
MNFFSFSRYNSYFLAAVFLMAAVTSCLSLDIQDFSDDFDYRKQASSGFSFANFEAEDETDSDDGEDLNVSKGNCPPVLFLSLDIRLFFFKQPVSTFSNRLHAYASQRIYLLCGQLLI